MCVRVEGEVIDRTCEKRDSPEQVEISLCQYYVQRYKRPTSLRRQTVDVEV